MRILLVEDEEKVSRFVARGVTGERNALRTPLTVLQGELEAMAEVRNTGTNNSHKCRRAW